MYMTQVVLNEKGQKVVVIDEIIFSSKRKIDWDGVEEYLKRYVGQMYVIEETDDIVYIGSDFPDEYANSKYTERAFGAVGKAKANATQVIPELIQNATNICWKENLEEKHRKDAKYGWYRCDICFSLSKCDDKKNVIGINVFRGRMIIRCDVDGKKYLYDIIDIKKET